LIDRKINTTDFRRELDIAYSTMAKLKKDEVVAMVVLVKICEFLDCNVEEIVEFVRTEKAEESTE